jgi:RHS repeat-associated protein
VDTDLAYDLAGRMIARETSEERETFAYDLLGNLVEARSTTAHVRVERDALGRIVKEVQVALGEEHVVEVRYDAIGERVERRTSLGHGEVMVRDAIGARTRTVLGGALAIEHAVDVLGREVKRRLPGGGAIDSSYDLLGRLEQRRAAAPAAERRAPLGKPAWVGGLAKSTTARRIYRYDAAGELVARYDRNDRRTELRYDPVGQLLAMIPEGARGEVFRYDATGNVYEGGDAPTRVYETGNRLLRKGDTTYRWDAEGRLVEKRAIEAGGAEKVWRYAWSDAGLLAAVAMPSGDHVELVYDPFARRVAKRVFAWDAETHTRTLSREVRYVWDADVLVHEIARSSGEGAGRDPVVEVRTYWFEDDEFSPAAHREPDGRWVHYVNDPIGTPEQLVDEAGDVVCELERRAWGLTAPSEANASTPLRFPGQYEDPETGLCYNRYRYYDPEVERFISPDPLEIRGGLNVWSYTPNSFTCTDVLGLTQVHIPKTVRRFLDKAELKTLQNEGFTFDPLDTRGGLSATSIHVDPKRPDNVRNCTGAHSADYYADIATVGLDVQFKGKTKGGVYDYKIKSSFGPEHIVDKGKVRKR